MRIKNHSKSQIPPDTNYLDLTPCPLISHKIEENGMVTLLAPRFTSTFWNKFIKPSENRKFIMLNLDQHGSATWILIDSKTKVGEICNKLLSQFGDQIQPVEQRVTKFLTQLYLNKYITFKEFIPE